MTVKKPITLQPLDERRMADLLTPVLLREYRDDAPYGQAETAPGTAWLKWGSAWRLDRL